MTVILDVKPLLDPEIAEALSALTLELGSLDEYRSINGKKRKPSILKAALLILPEM